MTNTCKQTTTLLTYWLCEAIMLPTCQPDTEQPLHLISWLSSLGGQNVQCDFWDRCWWAAAAFSRLVVKTSVKLLMFLQALSVSLPALLCVPVIHGAGQSQWIQSTHGHWTTSPKLRRLIVYTWSEHLFFWSSDLLLSSVPRPLLHLFNYVFTLYTIKKLWHQTITSDK